MLWKVHKDGREVRAAGTLGLWKKEEGNLFRKPASESEKRAALLHPGESEIRRLT